MSATFRVNPDALSNAISGARIGIAKGTEDTRRYIQQLLGQGGGPSTPGSPPALGSGALQRSFRNEAVEVGPSSVKQRTGSDSPYAAIHEFGGTINARDRSLTIPVNDRARELRASTNDLSTLNLTWRPSKSPEIRGLLFEGDELMFVLKDSVVLPPRPYLRTAARSVSLQRSVMASVASGIRERIGGRRG